MLYEATFQSELPTTLIAGRLDPLSFDLRAARDAARSRAVTAADIHTVREALSDGRYTSDRVLDRVVDRLLEELTW